MTTPLPEFDADAFIFVHNGLSDAEMARAIYDYALRVGIEAVAKEAMAHAKDYRSIGNKIAIRSNKVMGELAKVRAETLESFANSIKALLPTEREGENEGYDEDGSPTDDCGQLIC